MGKFRELRHGRLDGPSLRLAVRDQGDENEGLLVRYLRAGTVLAVTASSVPDVLSSSEEPVAHLALLTDGQWFWYTDLAYYVAQYHVRLDDRFVERVQSFGGTPPTVNPAELAALEETLLGATDDK